MAFIKYKKAQAHKNSCSGTIGINGKGRFAFYKPVVEEYLKDIEYIELLYDPEENRIGILPLSEATENAFRIQGKTTKTIIAKKFLKRFKIQIKSQRYEFRKDNQMLIIQL